MQKTIAIVTDSACDLPKEIVAKYDIHVVPLRITYTTGEYRDGVEISAEEIYSRLPQEIPKTSLPAAEDIEAVYDTLIEQGVKDIVQFCVSSGLSGTYNQVRLVAQRYAQRVNIHIVDTLSLSMQEGMMVWEFAKKMEAGASLKEGLEHVQALRQHSLGAFVIQTLEYLRKGGRIGLVEGVVGTLLQLKPIIFVNDNGVYQTLAKARGYERAIDMMMEAMLEKFEKRMINICVVYGAAREEGEKLLNKLKSLLNIQGDMLLPVSPVLGVHTGPSLVGIVAYEVAPGA